jgi:PAS domain S-box-containing protein
MSDTIPTRKPVDFFDVPLGAIAGAAWEALVIVDRQQNIVSINPAASDLFGYPADEIVGRPLELLVPERLRHRHAGQVRAFEASDQPERPARKRSTVLGLHKNGGELRIDAAVSRVSIVVDGRAVPFYVAVLHDMTAEHDLRGEIDALTRRIRVLLELAPVAMWIVEDDRVVFANRAAFDLFGVAPGEHLVGQSIFSLLRPEMHADLRSHLARALQGAPDVPLVCGGIVRPDGRQRKVEIASASLPDHGNTVVQMVISDITEREERLHDELRHRVDIRRLSASVVEAREEERRHIARELHDELGQRLTALKMELSTLRAEDAKREEDTGDPPGPHIAQMFEMLDDTVAAVRRIAADLRPLMLDDLGLNAAIEWLARDAARRMDIEIKVRLDREDPPLTNGATIAVFRMVQEALTNVSRHARATAVRIELTREGDEIVLVVRDNGVGFPERSLQREGRYGLLGIRERAFMFGGRLVVDNPSGGGGRITVRLPLKPAEVDFGARP